MDYTPVEIESKWQRRWEKAKLYEAKDLSKKPKCYLLIEFPYPSGARLHVGHGRSYCAFDALARMKRMQGFNVLFPFGWDAFGLPAENYAIKTGIHPSITVGKNIANAKKQAKSWGLSFDWSREINTTDPKYYRWTQWIFLQLFKKGLAYRAKIPVNWCPSCKTNLANEEVVGGACERCGTPVERRMQEQWMLKITAYADRLLNDLELVDYREDIKQQQINWIGRSEGARIKFGVISHESLAKRAPGSRLPTPDYIEVFTTRPDTVFGATFLVLAPEHPLVRKIAVEGQKKRVEAYIKASLKKSELQRQENVREKTGVFTGAYAKNPASGEGIPIWVSDFVLPGYGTGAIMAVPAHDQRDFEFAKKFKLPIKEVIKNKAESNFPKEAFTGGGELINSAEFTGLQSKIAAAKITAWLKKNGLGEPAIDYKLRDWVFSRQHYWGEPIPIVYCRKCWESKRRKAKGEKELQEGYDYVVINGVEHAIIPVPEESLPVKLPYLERYKPIGTGESPLAAAKDWVNVRCPRCGSPARRETDTMPNWAGSSWYYLAYCLASKLGNPKSETTKPKQVRNSGVQNSKRRGLEPLDLENSNLSLVSGSGFGDSQNIFSENKDVLSYWLPVDWYNGGMEHTTLHLLYSRFWYKFLFDLGLVPGPEPYQKRTSHGVILGPDGQKMSKSRGNVINPDDVVAEFGADTFRVYEMFMGPFDQQIAWDHQGVIGVRRFLERVWKCHHRVISQKSSVSSEEGLKRKLHQLVKKVEEDVLAQKFNTAIAAQMEFINELLAANCGLSVDDWKIFLRVLAPFAPHLAEELFYRLDPKPYTLTPGFSIHVQPWPKYDPKLIEEKVVTIVVQVNGKLRGKLEVARGKGKEEITDLAKQLSTVKPHLSGVRVAKTIFLPDNLINFVTKLK